MLPLFEVQCYKFILKWPVCISNKTNSIPSNQLKPLTFYVDDAIGNAKQLFEVREQIQITSILIALNLFSFSLHVLFLHMFNLLLLDE